MHLALQVLHRSGCGLQTLHFIIVILKVFSSSSLACLNIYLTLHAQAHLLLWGHIPWARSPSTAPNRDFRGLPRLIGQFATRSGTSRQASRSSITHTRWLGSEHILGFLSCCNLSRRPRCLQLLLHTPLPRLSIF